MSEPYIGEIRMFAGNFAPVGWMLCNGSLLPISQYEALFTLIGTTYGGDGQATFGLPNLQSRMPIHMGGGFTGGQQIGSETVTVTTSQLAPHTHIARCSLQGTTASPGNAVWATDPSGNIAPYSHAGANGMNANALGTSGGNQPHDNMQPYLVISFIISLFGVFPAQG